eukprot:526354-Pelagomonas_calceolata.AAC.2
MAARLPSSAFTQHLVRTLPDTSFGSNLVAHKELITALTPMPCLSRLFCVWPLHGWLPGRADRGRTPRDFYGNICI